MDKSLALRAALLSTGLSLSSCSFFEPSDAKDSETAVRWSATPLPHAPAPLPRTASGKIIAPPTHGAECKVVAFVDVNGSVRSANAVRMTEPDSRCPEAFAKVAEADVLTWHFIPSHREGTAIAALESVTVQFEAAPPPTKRTTPATVSARPAPKPASVATQHPLRPVSRLDTH